MDENTSEEVSTEATLAEAYAIMSGSTMMLPTVAHLLALREAHECDLIRVQALLRSLQQPFLM